MKAVDTDTSLKAVRQKFQVELTLKKLAEKQLLPSTVVERQPTKSGQVLKLGSGREKGQKPVVESSNWPGLGADWIDNDFLKTG